MKEKIIRIAFSILIMAIILFQFTILSKASESVSNELIAWGLKRSSNHQPPKLDASSLEVLNRFQGLAIGDSNKKNLYLTFDLGYEAGYTAHILDILKENNVKAVFFITGHYLNTQSDLVKRMIEEGHTIGNHTVNHKSLPTLSENEIEKEIMDLHKALYDKFGYEMTYFRPPKGEFSEKVLNIVNKLGYKCVLWSFAYDDWDENKQGREAYGKNKILENLHNGSILLLHATSKDNSNILGDVIQEARKMGYEFQSITKFE